MKQGYREPAWTDLADKDFAEWLTHLAGLQAKMNRWLTSRYPLGGWPWRGTMEDHFALALYDEIAKLSAEAKARLKREGK
jgi:hypothetical protein